MEAWERVDAKHDVAVKRGTDDVPADGRFHVLVDGEIVFSTGVETAALLMYDEARAPRMAIGRRGLEAERAYRDAAAFRNDVLGDKAGKKAKQGGRGKGGVGG
jgi:hypothetical protein